jgi:hypothetical protein
MEKSLENIEKSLLPAGAATGEGASAATSNLASMSLSIKTIVSALSGKSFKKTNADTILKFTEGMAAVAQDVDANSLKSLADLSTGISKFIETMSGISLMGMAKIMLASKIFIGGKNSLLGRIMRGISSSLGDFSNDQLEKVKKAGEGISSIGEGLKALSSAMGYLALVALAAPLVLIGAATARVVVGMFVSLGENAENIQKGGEAIGELGKGLVALSAGIATIALVAALVPAKLILESIVMIASLSLTFALIGKASETIIEGSNAVQKMGIALGVLSMGVALISLVVLLVPPKVLLGGMLLVAGYALVFAIAGKASKLIAEGAMVTILGIALGLFFFSGALLVFSLAIDKIGIGEAFLGIGLLFGFGVLFSQIGFESPLIRRGTEAMLMMSVGLAAFGVGLLLYALSLKGVMALFKNDWKEAAIGTVGIIIGMVGLFSLAGFAMPLIEPGAAAVASMGVALAIFGAGMLIYALTLKGVMALFKNDWEIASKATAGIILGLGVMFTAIGVMSPFIALGSVALLTMGISLAVFSVGFVLFSLATKAALSMGVVKEGKDGYEFTGTSIIESIMKGFARVGMPWISVPAAIGAASAVAVGASLLVLSMGLLFTSKVMEKIPDAADFNKKIFDKDNGIIGNLFEKFAEIGKKYGGFSMLLGLDDVSMGARAVKRISSTLSELAGGIAAFAKVDEVPVKIPDKNGNLKWTTVSLSTTLSNIRTVMIGEDGKGGILLTMAKIFGEIGNMPEVTGIPAGTKLSGAGGFFARMISNITGDTPMQRGIRAVSSIGDVLQSLAGGITAFANVNEIPVQVPDPKDPSKLIYKTVSLSTVLSNVRAVMIGEDGKGGILLSLASIFGEIGNMPEITGIPASSQLSGTGGFFARMLLSITGDTPLQRGIKAVSSIGDVLSTLAGGITAFANVDEIPVQIPSADGKSLIYKAVSLKDIVANIKASLIGDGPSGSNPGLLLSLASVFAQIGNDYPDGFFTDSVVANGAESVREISESIGGIAQTILAFAELEKRVPVEFDKDGKPIRFDKIDQSAIRTNLIEFIKLIPKTFAELDPEMLAKAETNAEDYKSLTQILSQLSSPVKNLNEAFAPKGKDQKGPLTMLSEELGKFLSFLSSNPITDTILEGLNKLYVSLNQFSNINSPFGGFVDSFNKFNTVFGSFSGNMKTFSDNFTKFSPQLKNYEKYATLLNSHAIYSGKFVQFEPAFRGMSNDLKIFAENFKLMDESGIEAFRIWTESLTDFVQVDLETFKDISDTLGKVIGAPIEAMAKALGTVTSPTPLKDDTGQKVIDETVKKNEQVVAANPEKAQNKELKQLKDMISQLSSSIDQLISKMDGDTGISVYVTNKS